MPAYISDYPSRSATRSPRGSSDPNRVLVFVGAGIGNHGNDASLEAILPVISRLWPRSNIVCVCHYPDIVSQSFGLSCLPMLQRPSRYKLVRAIDRGTFRVLSRVTSFVLAYRSLRDGDILLFPGTGLLDDLGDVPFGRPYGIFIWSLSARLRGAAIAMVSIGAGPIRHRISRFFLVRSARMAQYRSYRDVQSQNFLAEQNVDIRADAVYPDLVFSRKLKDHARKFPESDKQPVIGLGLVNYTGWLKSEQKSSNALVYVGKIAKLLAALIAAKRNVILIISEAEQDILSAIRDELKNKCLDVRDDDYQTIVTLDFDEQITAISNTDVLVAMRYHTAVSGLIQLRPVISIGYASKFAELMRTVNLADYFQPIETFDVSRLLGQIEECLREKSTISAMLASKIAQMQLDLAEQEQVIGSRLGVHCVPFNDPHNELIVHNTN
ncbi:MAG: hypothetical protein CTY31_02250 [Hyphomicrobium sp.]|nr:MAG: hypothetical protein CTY39_01035 [Hyphomicrobium sp.]PPD01597.1 MAG: hypothetical protein CTY31_02250 [Hyphomicrobium sp.]